MKKFGLLIIVLAIAAVTAQAQLLWRVSKPGSEKTSYLFGTHHFAPLTVLDSINVDKVVSAVDEVYGELSLDDMNRMATYPGFAQAMIAPADSTLDKVFTASELDEITTTLQKAFNEPMLPMIIKQMNMMKPAALDLIVAQLAVQKLMPDFDMTQQLDKTLLEKGASAGRPVKGLETLDKQINALFGGSISGQAASFLKGVRSSKGMLEDYKAMTDLYLAGNIEALAKMTTDSMTESQRKSLIEDRNDAWIDFLLGMLPTTTVFIICGAGHLGGDKGLIKQLRDNGYTVAPAL